MDRRGRSVSRFRLRLCLVAILCVGAVGAATARAAEFGRFLPPDKAFRFSAHAAPGVAELSWRIAKGYYLYKRRFEVKSDNAVLGAVVFPSGQTEDDPNFGKVIVYHRAVTLKVPIDRAPASGPLHIAVTYQGCAESGLCYAPITKHVSLSLPAAPPGGAAATSHSSGGVTGATTVSRQGRLANLVEHANPAWFVLVFFGLGLLLAFTPCVLPMVPVLAGVIGGESGRLSARRGLALSLVYVLAMALVYTAAGVGAGFAGTGLQGVFEAPWIIGLFAAIFVVLAGGLFGLYALRLPRAMTDRLTRWSGRQRGGTWVGAGFMGALSALIVSPCVAAPLAGALIVIGQSGEPVRGGIALFALALGMGAPLVVFGTVAGRLLPRAGGWMTVVERLLGVAMLAYAVWLLGRIVPAPLTLVLWGLTGIVAALFLGVFERQDREAGPGARLARAAGIGALLWAVALVVGGAAGGNDPLLPLRAFAGGGLPGRATRPTVAYQPVSTPAQLQVALSRAATARRPVMVDFYADWCTSCLEMEHTTLRDPRVQAALAQMEVLRVDVTNDTAAGRALMRRYGLYGPPAYILYDAAGKRLTADTVVGFMRPPAFLAHLRRALSSS